MKTCEKCGGPMMVTDGSEGEIEYTCVQCGKVVWKEKVPQ